MTTNQKPSKAFAVLLLSAAAKSGHEGTIKLAAQLANVQPCKKCNFVWTHCRCNQKELTA